ncbi:MAG TPA: hypothetical protein ENH49_04225 [Candidatus Marinimicrobia bacterium]|nr:hypothetical protein [Candidatus Neomarinimicrobiota bacterium]
MDERKYIEWYKFIRLSQMDIQRAVQTLVILHRYKKNDVRYALLRDFVVSYARPSVGSKGREIKKHILKLKHVPANQRELHGYMEKRHQVFAHNDLKHRDPAIANWSSPEKPWFPMSFKGSNYDKLDAKHADMLDLAETVLSNINDEIAKMEPRLLLLSQQMAQKLFFT